MLCPHCKVELKLADRQGIEIDYCPNCRGIWLDRGELDKILDRSTAMGVLGSSAYGGYAAPPRDAQRYDGHDDEDDDDEQRRRYGQPGPGQPGYNQPGYRRRKESWLGNLFDF